MSRPDGPDEELIEKLRALPPDKLSEVEDFVDFLRHRDNERRLAQTTTKLSEGSFGRVWENPDDAEYDRL